MILVSNPIVIVTSVDDLEQRMRSEKRVSKDKKRRVPLGDRENAAPNAPTMPPKNGGAVPTFTLSTPQRYALSPMDVQLCSQSMKESTTSCTSSATSISICDGGIHAIAYA